MLRVVGVILAFSLSAHAMSEPVTGCDDAIRYLQQGQITQSRDSLRVYLAALQETGRQDGRCNDTFIQNLAHDYLVQLDQRYGETCQTYLQQKQPATPEELVALDGLSKRVLALEGQLSQASLQCYDNVIQRYVGLDWLARHRPRLEQVRIDCQKAKILLELPVSRRSFEEAGAILRISQVAFWLEEAMLDEQTLTQTTRDFYEMSLVQAAQCLAFVEKYWLAERR